MFVAHVFENFPGWQQTLQEMISSSLSKFEGKYPNFVQELKKALDKEDDDSLTLGNAIFYLDYYYSAIDNGKNPSVASITGELESQVNEYYKATFDTGLLGKDSYNRVLANGYLKHIVNMLNLKKQDISEGNLQDKRIHELKANVDFGSKLTILCIMKVLGENVDDWGYTYGDTVKHELQKDGDRFLVASSVNGQPLLLDGSDGTMELDDFNDFMIDHMYYGSIVDAQKDQDPENPDNHVTRDSADSESDLQWWANQKKYEDRVLLKNTLDTTPLDLHTMDKSEGGQSKTTAPAADDDGTGSGSGSSTTMSSEPS